MIRKTLVSLICSLFVLAGCVATSATDTPTSGAEPELPSWPAGLWFTVPDYIGMSLAQAQQVSSVDNVIFKVTYLDETALLLKFGNERANWPENDTVFHQIPAPQSKLVKDEARVVNISIADWEVQTGSATPPTMPDLRQKPEAVAQLKEISDLTVREFNASLKEVLAAYGSNVENWPATNSIVSFSPAAGQAITDNQVEISYMGEPTKYWQGQELQNLVGQTKQNAQVALEDLGLPYSINQQDAASIASLFGKNLAQWPEVDTVTGYSVDSTDHASVELNVASWQKEQLFPQPVPELAGLGVGEAKTLLDGLGYASIIQQVESAERPETVLNQRLQLSNDSTHVEVLLLVASAEENGKTAVNVVDVVPELDLPTLADSDFDGVPDAIDICPRTERAATVDAKGCSAGDLVKHLEYGIYRFLPDSREMEAERQQPYNVTITLQTAQNKTPKLTIRPTIKEFDELAGKVPESLEVIERQAILEEEIPHIIERWSPEMTLKLEAVNKAAATITPERIKRLVERGKTEFNFKVYPKCVGTFSCDPLILEVSALAHLGADKPIPLFEGEKFVVKITMNTLVASFLDKWGVVFFSVIIGPIILLWLGKRFFGQGGS